MAEKKPEQTDKFVTPSEWLKKVEKPESFRDLPLAKQKRRLRDMYQGKLQRPE